MAPTKKNNNTKAKTATKPTIPAIAKTTASSMAKSKAPEKPRTTTTDTVVIATSAAAAASVPAASEGRKLRSFKVAPAIPAKGKAVAPIKAAAAGGTKAVADGTKKPADKKTISKPKNNAVPTTNSAPKTGGPAGKAGGITKKAAAVGKGPTNLPVDDPRVVYLLHEVARLTSVVDELQGRTPLPPLDAAKQSTITSFFKTGPPALPQGKPGGEPTLVGGGGGEHSQQGVKRNFGERDIDLSDKDLLMPPSPKRRRSSRVMG
ncbi:hypothetical protein EDC01DRAFT_782354 [Geopyxis carbonaria]|nr:hypothetical protein EDC01DRAFT_782354 [Geopyxis carbonaria]